MKVKVGISNRHVHLNKETYDFLFKNEHLTVRNYLTQPDQFASTKTLDVVLNNHVIENVRIVGPIRSYNQIELLESDFLNGEDIPPRRQSGELDGSLPVILRNGDKEIKLENGLIIAEKHIHMDKSMADKLNLKHNEELSIYKDEDFYFKALIKITPKAFYELHIDKDDAAKYNLISGEEMDIKIQ